MYLYTVSKLEKNSSIRVVTQNNNPATSEQFEGFFDQARTVAAEKKAEREQAQRTTMGSFVDKFGAFLRGEPDTQSPHAGEPQLPGEQPPPADQPPMGQ